MSREPVDLPASPPALPPELEAVVLADVLRVTDGDAATRIAKAAEAIRLFRAEMAK